MSDFEIIVFNLKSQESFLTTIQREHRSQKRCGNAVHDAVPAPLFRRYTPVATPGVNYRNYMAITPTKPDYCLFCRNMGVRKKPYI